MRHPELAIGTFVAMIAVLIPLPRLWRAHNIPCLAMIFWFFQHNLIYFVHSIIWAGNANISALVWCDISNKLQAGAGIALPAATLCLARYLEIISRGQLVNQHFRTRFDLAMCIGLPVIWMFLAYCFQSKRTTIIEDFGCSLQIYRSLVPILLFRVPPLLLSVATLIFGAISLFHLARSRKITVMRDETFTGILSCSQYLRLILICVVTGIWGSIWLSLQLEIGLSELDPFPSWNVIHSEISVVLAIPTDMLAPEDAAAAMSFWWSIPGASYFFFILFGTSRDVLSEYSKFWMWLRMNVSKRTTTPTQTTKEVSVQHATDLPQQHV